MMFDELSINFENPATDALGYEHVEGRLFCGRDYLELHFDEKDRAFVKIPPVSVRFTYDEVERIEYLKKWFRPGKLIFRTHSPEKLAQFPGAKVGMVKLQVTRDSIRDASRVAGLIEFRQAEAYLGVAEERLRRTSTEL